MKTDNRELFENMPVRKAVFSLVVPTIISQLITVIYNMADTFFIGQLNDSNQVAAASLAMPLFILLTGIANLFGIGGSSHVARSLGAGDREKAKHAAAFSIWTASAVSVLYGLILLVFRPYILPAVGADEETYEYVYRYVFWTITVGAVPTVLSAELAHLVRSEGCAKQASFGVAMGGVLNIFLDPLFISVFGLQIAGAAIATMLSNVCASAYFLILLYRRRRTTVITLNPRFYSVRQRIPREVLLVGLPSSMMNLMGVCSNIVMNRLMASYCNEAVAGVGIAKKIDLLAFAIATGMSQGVLPLIGYNYSAKNYRRMRASIRTTFAASLTMAIVGAVLLFTCAGPIVGAFIDDALTVHYGRLFQRIICITGPCISVTMIVITMFQSVGKKVQPLVLSLLRKGGLDIPVMFLMNALIGVEGIVWATPIADVGAMLAALALFVPFWRRIRQEERAGETV